MKSGPTYSSLMVKLLVVVVAIHACELFARFPCNHTNNLMFPYRYCAFVLGLFEVIRTLILRNANFVFWLIIALVFSMPFIEDKLNVMMPYETWIERGMPGWGAIGQTYSEANSDYQSFQVMEQTSPKQDHSIDNDEDNIYVK